MKLKVLIFIDWFAPGFKAGGPITSNVNIVSHLSNVFDFYIITSDYDYHATVPYENIISNKWTKWNGANVIYLSHNELFYKNLKKIAKEVDCDVWYINGIYSKFFSIYPLIIAKSIKPKKMIVSARGMLSPHALAVKAFSKKMYIGLAKICGLYDNVIFHATNDEEAGYIRNAISKKSKVAVAENLPRKMELQLDGCKKQSGELRLVSFARISSEKNTLFAIRALKGCRENIVYHIYGQINSDAYWQECLSAVKELPFNVAVEYKGTVAPSEMSKIYKNYHALYLPSTGENYGHAILESFMNACPVIISNRTPWLELEKKNIGWDLPLNEKLYAPIIDGLAKMNDEEFGQMRLNVVKFIQSYLSDNTTRNRYIELFSL